LHVDAHGALKDPGQGNSQDCARKLPHFRPGMIAINLDLKRGRNGMVLKGAG